MQKAINYSVHERVLLELFDKEEELVIFDIGACEGLSSLRYTRIFNNCETYAFEPLPSNLEIINSNKKENNLSKLKVFDLALSDSRGVTEFHISSGQPENKVEEIDHGNKSSSILAPDKAAEVFPWLKFENKIKVETETLKNFCSDQNISSIDFIHMDVQGAELLVLKGAGDMITKIKSVWLEVEKVALYEGQALKPDIEKFFRKNSFVRIINEMDHVSGDQLWVYEPFLKSKVKGTQKRIRNITYKTNLKSAYISFVKSARTKIRPRSRIRTLLGN